jgi:hypothetical protein
MCSTTSFAKKRRQLYSLLFLVKMQILCKQQEAYRWVTNETNDDDADYDYDSGK